MANNGDLEFYYSSFLKPLLLRSQIHLVRVHTSLTGKKALHSVKKEIASCKGLIALMESQNINVAYEVGIANAMDVPILIAHSKLVNIGMMSGQVYTCSISTSDETSEAIEKFLSQL